MRHSQRCWCPRRVLKVAVIPWEYSGPSLGWVARREHRLALPARFSEPWCSAVNPPHYFVPHASTPAELVRPDASALVNVVDAFRLEMAYLGEREWIVGLDAVGQLIAVPGGERGQLPASAQAQLAHHEVTSGRAPRHIAASELFFFSVELVEHPTEAEGAHDPVCLYNFFGG